MSSDIDGDSGIAEEPQRPVRRGRYAVQTLGPLCLYLLVLGTTGAYLLERLLQAIRPSGGLCLLVQ